MAQDVGQVRPVGKVEIGPAGWAGAAHGLAREGDALHTLRQHPPEPRGNREALRGQAVQRGLAGGNTHPKRSSGVLGAKGDVFGTALPDHHPSPARRGAFLRIGDDSLGRPGRVGEPLPFAFGTGVFLRLQPEVLPRDVERLRHVHCDLVAAYAERSVPQPLAKGVGNGRLDGQLERCAVPHPSQMPRIGGPKWDATRLVAHDRVLEVHAVQVAEKGEHVEKRRFPAGVRPDQHVEGSEPLRYVAQGAEPERLDPRHDEAVAFGFRRFHHGASCRSACSGANVNHRGFWALRGAPSDAVWPRVSSSTPGSTASHAASSQPWNTTASPT